MFTSFLVYSILIILMIFCGYLISMENRTSFKWTNPLIIGIIGIYTFICGIRYDVGVDYMGYYISYMDFFRTGTSIAEISLEPGWNFITKTLAINGVHPTIYFSLIAFVQISCIIFAFKKHPKLLPYAIFLFFWFFFTLYLNVLRQTIVVSLFFYIAMRHRKISFFKYTLFALICFFIHRTGILIILIYPLLRFKIQISPLILTITYILAVIIGISVHVLNEIVNNPIVSIIIDSSSYSAYQESGNLDQSMSGGIETGYVIRTILNILIIYKYKVLFRQDDYRVWFLLFYIGYTLSSLFPTSILITRLFWFFTIFSIPVYAVFLRYCFSGKHRFNFVSLRYGIGIMVAALLMTMGMKSIVISTDNNKTEYHHFWERRTQTY